MNEKIRLIAILLSVTLIITCSPVLTFADTDNSSTVTDPVTMNSSVKANSDGQSNSDGHKVNSDGQINSDGQTNSDGHKVNSDGQTNSDGQGGSTGDGSGNGETPAPSGGGYTPSGGGGGGSFGGDAFDKAADPTEADKAAAASLTDQINALPAEITLDDIDQTKSVIDSYNKLTDEQKSILDPAAKAKIAAAETKYNELAAPASKVKELIEAIPDDVTQATKAQVKEARKAYDALADQLKVLVSESEISHLEKAEFHIESTEAASKSLVVKKAKAVKGRKATVTWKKVAGADGYQISYSTNKKFTKKSTKRIGVKAKSSKKNLKKLKAGKKYYVKVRAYTKVYDPDKKAEVKIYGKWSKAKSIKVKK